MLLEKVERYIARNALLDPAARVVVGVSGGLDSVVLLSMLRTLGYELVVAHCNFHLRGKESDRDEAFVRRMAKDWDLPLEVVHFDTLGEVESSGESVEMVARRLRYDWFEELRQAYTAAAVAVAHHADDQAETVLLNLLRGCGYRGLVGMKPNNTFVVRPLLGCRRKALAEYAERNNLCSVEDSTNADTLYRRNNIRHTVIPLLETINPAVVAHLSDLTNYMGDLSALIEQGIGHNLSRLTAEPHPDPQTTMPPIVVERLLSMPAPLNTLWEYLCPLGFASKVIGELYDAMIDGSSDVTYYSAMYRVVLSRGVMYTLPAAPKRTSPISISSVDDLDAYFEAKSVSAAQWEIVRDDKLAQLDADKLHYPLTLRSWREGDRFYPLGLKGSQSVSDFFTRQRLPAFMKEEVRMLVDVDGRIVWIVGIRIDHHFRITPSTTNLLVLRAR